MVTIADVVAELVGDVAELDAPHGGEPLARRTRELPPPEKGKVGVGAEASVGAQTAVRVMMRTILCAATD